MYQRPRARQSTLPQKPPERVDEAADGAGREESRRAPSRTRRSIENITLLRGGRKEEDFQVSIGPPTYDEKRFVATCVQPVVTCPFAKLGSHSKQAHSRTLLFFLRSSPWLMIMMAMLTMIDDHADHD